MIILVSSNIISGAYTVLEIVLTVVLARLLTSIAGTMNVKAIYEDRQKLSLTTSRIPAISDPGLTIPGVHFIITLIFVIVSLLMTAGQFGIVGVTEKEYEEVIVKYLVNKAPPGYLIDVENHISVEKKKVSKELILLGHSTRCFRRTISGMESYASIYDGDDIERPISDPYDALDIACVNNDFGFEKKVAHSNTMNVNLSSYVGAIVLKCNISVNENGIAWRRMTRASVVTRCPLTVKEAWCYKDTRLYCTAVLEHSGVDVLLILGYDLVGTRRVFMYHLLPDGEEFGTEKLKAGALIMAVEAANGPGTLIMMLSSWVERNATVRKIINPSRQATKVHVPLLSTTLVPSVIILLFTMSVAYYMWRKVVFVPGRQGYNRFNSAADLLSCAAVEKFRDGGCRYRRSGKISVGLNDCEEYGSLVKPDGKSVDCKGRTSQ